MEYLAMPYIFVENLRYSLESGENLQASIKKFIAENPSSFTHLLQEWLVLRQVGKQPFGEFQRTFPVARKSIFDLLDLAYGGVSVIEPLKSMEAELFQMCDHDLAKHLDKLPYKLMIPMMTLQFPAVLLLLIGPLLVQFFTEIGGGM